MAQLERANGVWLGQAGAEDCEEGACLGLCYGESGCVGVRGGIGEGGGETVDGERQRCLLEDAFELLLESGVDDVICKREKNE